MKYGSVVMERIYTSLTQGLEGGVYSTKRYPFCIPSFYWQKEGSNPRRKGLTLLFSFYKNVVFPAQAEYSYLSANLRLKIFRSITLELQLPTFPLQNVLGHKLQFKIFPPKIFPEKLKKINALCLSKQHSVILFPLTPLLGTFRPICYHEQKKMA